MQNITITEYDIEAMCQLAEDVMQKLYMEYIFYDDDGNEIDWTDLPKEETEKLFADPKTKLLYELFRRGDRIEDVRYYTQEQILPWIEPILHKVIQLFRKGTGWRGETLFVAADSVSDQYLTSVFIREIRNMMMIFAGQILTKEESLRYLLILGHPMWPDDDEWIGIFFDDEKLKKAYERAQEELEEKRDKYGDVYDDFRVSIWEFSPNCDEKPVSCDSGDWKSDWVTTGKQFVKRVEPETLHCFNQT